MRDPCRVCLRLTSKVFSDHLTWVLINPLMMDDTLEYNGKTLLSAERLESCCNLNHTPSPATLWTPIISVPRILPYTSLAESAFIYKLIFITNWRPKNSKSVTHCHILCTLQLRYGEGVTDIQKLEETPNIKLELKFLTSRIEKREILKTRNI